MVASEDIGRQVLTYGERYELCQSEVPNNLNLLLHEFMELTFFYILSHFHFMRLMHYSFLASCKSAV